MNKQHTQNIFSNNHIKLLWIALAVVTGSLCIAGYILHRTIEVNERTSITVDYLANYEQSKYNFCYDRQIVPCNEDTLHDWSYENEDDAFEFKRGQAIGDDIDKIVETRR